MLIPYIPIPIKGWHTFNEETSWNCGNVRVWKQWFNEIWNIIAPIVFIPFAFGSYHLCDVFKWFNEIWNINAQIVFTSFAFPGKCIRSRPTLPLRYLNSQFNWYHLPQTPAPNEEKWPDLKQCIATLSYFVQTLSHPLNWPQSITWTSDGPCPVNLKITFQNTKFSYGNIFTDQKEIHFKKSSEILFKIDDLAAFVILSRPQFY